MTMFCILQWQISVLLQCEQFPPLSSVTKNKVEIIIECSLLSGVIADFCMVVIYLVNTN